MSRLSEKLTPRRLKLAFYLTLMAILLLVGYRVYLSIFEGTYHAVHAEQIERIQDRADNRTDGELHFAVVGNINNSVGLFERKMIPRLNRAGPDFVVSAGNAVSGGGEDKYRALYRTLSHLEMPYLLTVGEKESGAFGSFNFYEHFGPYFFSFRTGGSQFLFLDSTDPDTYPFQLHWLKEQLRDPSADHRFVFIGHPLFHTARRSPLDFDDQYLTDATFRDRLHDLFRMHDVDAVFSSNLHLFDQQTRDGVRYVVTGGAGGLVLNDDTSYYHYVDVTTDDGEVEIAVERLDIGQHQFFKTLESLWFFIHSLFYVGHLNFLLVLGLLILLAIKLYSTIFVERDYYRNYDIDTSPWTGRTLSIAMVTNNYLPFIGGVPISIDRLRRGLEQLSHHVRIIAPSYANQDDRDSDVIRVPSLLSMGRHGEFRLANPLSPRIRRGLKTFAPDLIHIHHPFWLGWVAHWHARRLKVPTVFTYHTRLEHYSHYVPLPGPLFRNLIAHTAIRRFANRCDGVIVPTESAEEYLRVIGVTTPIYVHPTGIDFDRFQADDPEAVEALRLKHGIGPDERVLVSVSRLSREKNIDFLIAAMDELHRRSDRPFRCLIIGDGDEHERLQTRIDALDLTPVVTLVGAVSPDEMARYYQLGDAFAFASKSETQGMVILEAMAAGLPVVAVRSSGIDDVVNHESNGFKTAEDIDHWATAAGRLIEDDALRSAMAERATATARRHAIDHFARDVAMTYAQVLALYHRPRNETRGKS
ncbi:MAG: glycosyltransferase [Guyparkeria sp.]|uniref:glycosyltransferase n=1 Tax=Guyparkeria sp. TaxID=2035736 RepID=UPI00397850DA